MNAIVLPATDEKIQGFVDAITAKNRAYMMAEYPRVAPDQNLYYEAMRGPRYTRIVTCEYGRRASVFCFIDNATGCILKAAGWKKPAKHSRGTIHAENFGAGYVGPYGAAYLR